MLIILLKKVPISVNLKADLAGFGIWRLLFLIPQQAGKPSVSENMLSEQTR